MNNPLRRVLLSFVILVAIALVFFSITTRAISPQDIVFPVPDLGNCKSENDCRAYCEQRDNADVIRACLVKDCAEMSVCLSKYGEETGEVGKLDPSLEAEMTAKITACAKAKGGQGKEGEGKEEAPRSAQPLDYTQYCPRFESAPSCSYAGSPDSQNYQLCKKCYPDK